MKKGKLFFFEMCLWKIDCEKLLETKGNQNKCLRELCD